MTEQDFLALPNRKKDALVAEKVMGFDPTKEPLERDSLPYSTDIAAAWEVVEKTELLCRYHLTGFGDFWEVGENIVGDEWSQLAEAGTPSLAICLAALKAKGVVSE